MRRRTRFQVYQTLEFFIKCFCSHFLCSGQRVFNNKIVLGKEFVEIRFAKNRICYFCGIVGHNNLFFTLVTGGFVERTLASAELKPSCLPACWAICRKWEFSFLKKVLFLLDYVKRPVAHCARLRDIRHKTSVSHSLREVSFSSIISKWVVLRCLLLSLVTTRWQIFKKGSLIK